MRCQMETTSQQARQRLGVETQGQWSDMAIGRTTPALLGIFSLVTLFAHQGMERSTVGVRPGAWYPRPHPTFADALALVREELWAHAVFRESLGEPDTVRVPRAFVEHLTETHCSTA
jgi:hypothetical protein